MPTRACPLRGSSASELMPPATEMPSPLTRGFSTLARKSRFRAHAAKAPAPQVPLKARAKTKIQLVLQEICDWGSLNKLHLAQNGGFSPQTRGFTRKNPELTSPNRPQSQFSCKIARKVVAAAGRNTDPQINWGNGPKLWQAIGHSRANNDNPCAKQGSGPYHRNDERNPHVTEPSTTQLHDSANCESRYIQQLNRRQKRF